MNNELRIYWKYSDFRMKMFLFIFHYSVFYLTSSIVATLLINVFTVPSCCGHRPLNLKTSLRLFFSSKRCCQPSGVYETLCALSLLWMVHVSSPLCLIDSSKDVLRSSLARSVFIPRKGKIHLLIRHQWEIEHGEVYNTLFKYHTKILF